MKRRKNSGLSEKEVAEFWDRHDVTEGLDLSSKKRIKMVYKPPVQSISLRLPVPLLTQIKQFAAKMDIAYQALIKVWLAEKAKENLSRK